MRPLRAPPRARATALDGSNPRRRFIEEFSTSNFLAVVGGKLVTPKSPSILPSCTKRVVMQAAADMGLEVVERPVPWDEVGSFEEVAACGTAVVLTPIQSITRGTETVRFGSFDTISKLYDLSLIHI